MLINITSVTVDFLVLRSKYIPKYCVNIESPHLSLLRYVLGGQNRNLDTVLLRIKEVSNMFFLTHSTDYFSRLQYILSVKPV